MDIQQVERGLVPKLIIESQATKASGISDRWLKDLAAEEGLNKRAIREQGDRQAIGGLRAPHRSVARIPQAKQYKDWLWPILKRSLPDDAAIKRVMSTLGITDTPSELQEAARRLRGELAKELHTEVLNNEGLQGPLVHGLAVMLQD